MEFVILPLSTVMTNAEKNMQFTLANFQQTSYNNVMSTIQKLMIMFLALCSKSRKMKVRPNKNEEFSFLFGFTFIFRDFEHKVKNIIIDNHAVHQSASTFDCYPKVSKTTK